jgi:diaminopimelate decarboxylase
MRKHSPFTQFPIKNDQFVVGGFSVHELADKAGQTPFYAYSSAAITQRVAQLRKQLPPTIALHYAIKANPMPEVVNHLAKQLDGLDIASQGELNIALANGMDAQKISFAGPAKTTVELTAALHAGVVINVESAEELKRIHSVSENTGLTPNIALRVNPDFELKSSGMKMGGGPKPFGIDAELIPQVMQQLYGYGFNLQGLHIYCGSQNLNSDAIIASQNASFALAYQLAQYAQQPLKHLNIGGGFGIPYFPGEQPLAIQPIADNLQQQLITCQQHLGDTQVIIELGRYLVGEAGIYVCEVIERKISRGRIYLMTNGGLHHHLAASGNFGQVIRKNYPLVNARHVNQGERETVNVVGPLCTPLDILGENIELAKADAGDLLVVLQSGAYGFSASPQQFLSHPPPKQIYL